MVEEKMSKKLVLKLGGSVLFKDLNAEHLLEYANIIAEILKQYSLKLAIVVGGGQVAKEYCKVARKLGADNVTADEIGIFLTRVNAELFRLALLKTGVEVPPKVAYTISDVVNDIREFNISISGGFFPGQSTDACAALIAEKIQANYLLIGTNVRGVFSADPRKVKTAKKIDEITVDELMQILFKESSEAGKHPLVDFVALKLVERAKIFTVIFDATNPKNVKDAIEGILSNDKKKILKIGSIVRARE